MTVPAPERCSLVSRAVGESPEGTASTVRAFVLLECPGPWGVDAVRDSRLPDSVKQHLGRLTRAGVRPLLIRRPRRPEVSGTRLFAATGGRLWTAVLDETAAVTELDLTGLRDGQVPAVLTPDDRPLFAVCTHGRHDACCAEWGRPLAAAMQAAEPDLAWEVSHIGGDRFAPNVLVLPEALYYGRIDPDEAARFVADHRAGKLDLDHLRGRSSLPFAVQAAEIHLRRRLDDRRLPAYPLVRHDRREGDDGAVHSTATFDVDGTLWAVDVRTHPGPPHRLTCRALREESPPAHDLVGITSLGRA